jgi:mannitol-1-phosphate 5-dehydrogenase
LPIIAKTIANVIRHRFEAGNKEYLNFVLCENKIDSHIYMREILRGLLNDEEYDFSEKYIGFCQSSIGCMVPAPPKELLEENPLIVCVEDYNKIYTDKSGARGELPEIKNSQKPEKKTPGGINIPDIKKD